MKSRWLISLGVLVVVASQACSQIARLGAPIPTQPANAIQTVGYLLPPGERETHPLPTTPYRPQAGDLILCDDFNRLHHFLFKFANTGSPTHAAIVIARADGSPALLDLTGPSTIRAKVIVHDIEPRLTNYKGMVLVRRIKQPLTPEQSRELTHFAHTEAGKSFALGRILLQGTPFCPRTGLRKAVFGKTYLTRDRWFCSEMVVAGCVSAQILDPKTCRANATYPRDLAMDEVLDLSHIYHPPVHWAPAKSARD